MKQARPNQGGLMVFDAEQLVGAEVPVGDDHQRAEIDAVGRRAQAAAEVIQSVAVPTTGPGIRCAAPS